MFIRAAAAGAFLLLAAAPTATTARTQAPDAPEGCAWMGPERPDFLACQKADGGTEEFRAPLDFDKQTVAKASAGDSEAMRMMAAIYGRGQPPVNQKLAVEWLTKAAEARDPIAMNWLAVILLEGEVVPAESEAGMRWLKAAAEAGFPAAMDHLGYRYATGKGVPKDDVEAAKWFLAGAEAGYANAMRNIAISYDRGLGVPRDKAEAARWRQRQADLGQRTREPSEWQKQMAYPIEAAAANIQAKVMLRCELDDALFATKCRVESEDPIGWGFGDAALRIAPKVQLTPGLPPGSLIRLPIPFKLEAGGEPREMVDKCAAYAIALNRAHPLGGVSGWYARYWQARSRFLARQAGEPEAPERLNPGIAEAEERLAKGKERGMFGMIGRCSLS